MLGNSGLWIAAFFACACIGAVAVPVNTRFRIEELRFCLKQADVKLLLYVDNFLGIDFTGLLRQVEPAIDRGLPGDALPCLRGAVMVGEGQAPAACRPWRTSWPPATRCRIRCWMAWPTPLHRRMSLLMQYTSGTTSFPKGVMLRPP